MTLIIIHSDHSYFPSCLCVHQYGTHSVINFDKKLATNFTLTTFFYINVHGGGWFNPARIEALYHSSSLVVRTCCIYMFV